MPDFYIVDTSGNPISNASISCGGCAVTSGGGGYFSVDIDLEPWSGGFGVAAPGFLPTFVTWWSSLGGHVVTLTEVAKIIDQTGDEGNDQGDTSPGDKWH
jgi:hypothetical protein